MVCPSIFTTLIVIGSSEATLPVIINVPLLGFGIIIKLPAFSFAIIPVATVIVITLLLTALGCAQALDVPTHETVCPFVSVLVTKTDDVAPATATPLTYH